MGPITSAGTPTMQMLIEHGTKVVASAAIVEERHVLLVQEGRGREARRWNLPGGKPDGREPLAAAAVRETREESGIEVSVTGLLGTYPYVHRTGDRRLRVVFWADALAGAPAPDGKEILDTRWFAIDQLLDLPARRFAKPALLRAIFADLRRGVRHPVSALAGAR